MIAAATYIHLFCSACYKISTLTYKGVIPVFWLSTVDMQLGGICMHCIAITFAHAINNVWNLCL